MLYLFQWKPRGKKKNQTNKHHIKALMQLSKQPAKETVGLYLPVMSRNKNTFLLSVLNYVSTWRSSIANYFYKDWQCHDTFGDARSWVGIYLGFSHLTEGYTYSVRYSWGVFQYLWGSVLFIMKRYFSLILGKFECSITKNDQ